MKRTNEPNKALEGMRVLVTPAANAAFAPSTRIPQLGRSAKMIIASAPIAQIVGELIEATAFIGAALWFHFYGSKRIENQLMSGLFGTDEAEQKKKKNRLFRNCCFWIGIIQLGLGLSRILR